MTDTAPKVFTREDFNPSGKGRIERERLALRTDADQSSFDPRGAEALEQARRGALRGEPLGAVILAHIRDHLPPGVEDADLVNPEVYVRLIGPAVKALGLAWMDKEFASGFLPRGSV